MSEPNSATAVATENAAETVLRLFGESQAMWDPFRFRVWLEMGLTTAQLRVLSVVRESPGISSGDLAKQLGVTPPTITGLIDRLARLDLVERSPDPDDRRLVRHTLTDAGDAICSRLETGVEVFTRHILGEMSDDELKRLAEGMRAFIAASERVAQSEPNLAIVAMPEI